MSGGTTVSDLVDGLYAEDIQEFTADDRALLKQALDLEAAYTSLNDAADPSVTTTVTAPAFITSATLSLNQIGGVVDATFLFGGQHVSAGSINVDGSGHSATAVSGYHGMTLGLSSGVVEGANASLGVYIDDNGVKSAASDDFTTWTDESQAVVDPVYGATIGGGYSTEVAGLTAGGNLAFGLYDLLGTPAWALSVMPSVSGLGGSADLEIAYGLDLFYTKAALSYGIMGITPTATIHFISETGDNALAYAATPTSVLGNLKATGGFGADLGLAADLGQFLPIASSINAGLDMGFPTGGSLEMAWSAGLSVTPLTGLTASASFSGDQVAGNFTRTSTGAPAFPTATELPRCPLPSAAATLQPPARRPPAGASVPPSASKQTKYYGKYEGAPHAGAPFFVLSCCTMTARAILSSIPRTFRRPALVLGLIMLVVASLLGQSEARRPDRELPSLWTAH